MGTASSSDSTYQEHYSFSKQTKQGNDDRRKKFSKFNTLKKKLIRSRSSYKCQDHGKLLRDIMQTWSTQDISALVEEYESLFVLKECSMEKNLARLQVSSLKKDLASLFENSYCFDVTLLYDGIQFPVHRAILSARCSYFKDLFSHCDVTMKSVVKIDMKAEEISADMFSTLLHYLYTGEILHSQKGQDNLDILIKLGDEFGTPNVLEQDFKSLLSSAEFADTLLVYPGENHPDMIIDSDTIMNHTYELPCHRAVLCARSPYFRSLFLGKNSNVLAADSCGVTRLVLEESIIPRQYARILLQCLYTDSVDLSFIVKWGSQNRKDSRPETHKLLTTAEIAMEVYEVANFTDFTILAQGCEDIIAEELSLSTLLQTLEWSSQPHGSDWVHKQAIQFMEAEFVNIAHSDIFPFLPKKYLVHLLKSDFLQASEYDVLMAVIRWGEAQVLKQSGQQDLFLDGIGKKNTKRPREVDNKAVKQELSGVIEHVRIRHLLPAHGDLLDNAMRRGLVERGIPLDIGERSFYPCSPWMRNQGEKSFVRPRLFMPYYEESKVILQEHTAAEMERVRLRMVRMCQTMPDTLYMVSGSSPKQKSLRRALSQSFPVVGASVSAVDRESTQTVRDQRKDLSDGNEIHGTQAVNLSDKRGMGSEDSTKVVRELHLPDVAMEVAGLYGTTGGSLAHNRTVSPMRSRRPNSVYVTREHDERSPNSVPDVTISSSPTVILDSRSDSLPGYFRFEPRRVDLFEDEVLGSSS